MRLFLKRLCRNRKLDDVVSVGSEKRRDLGQAYVEHQLSLEELADIYADSYIDTKSTEQSDGLSCVEAQKRLEDGGLNVVQKPQNPSRIRLLINQHFYKFWLLLVGASMLSIFTYVIRFYIHNDDTTINLTTAYILLPVVFIMVMLSFWQERRTVDSCTVSTNETALSKHSTVLRDCRTIVVPTEHLVIGDLVFIFSGQRLPGDVRILQSNSLKIDTSAIIGKSDPIEYTHETAGRDVSVFDARNVGFQGTYCTEGDGLGLLIRTGRFTFLGNMADVKWIPETKSLLRKDIKQIVDTISKIAVSMALIFFLIGIIIARFENVLYYFIVGFLIIIVANVPQGLAPAIMSYLAIIAKRLRRKSILIKNLDTIDELGAATVLAISKAGILTQNCLKITDVWYNQKNIKVGRDQAKIHKKIQQHIEVSKARDALHQVIGITSKVWRHSIGQQSVRRARAASVAAATQRRESTFQTRKKLFTVVHESGLESIRGPDNFEKRLSILSTDDLQSKRSSINELNFVELGEDVKPQQQTTYTNNTTTSSSVPDCQHRNSTDVAMQNYLMSVNYPMEYLKRYYKPVYEIPYSSLRRWQLVICRCLSRINSPLFPTEELSNEQSVYVCMIKGAPEVVLKQCTSFFNDKNSIQPIDEKFESDCFSIWETYGLHGKRTIAFALKYFVAENNQKFSASEQNFPNTELIFLGLSAFLDPPRTDSVKAIKECKDAGLKIYMITGDHPSTSLAVASQIGLIEDRIDKIPRLQSQLEFTMQTGKNWAVVHGQKLEQMTQTQWDELLAKPYIVFARTTPEETLSIVEACQARNEIIALACSMGTVNDAPALAASNIGIASSKTSTDIAIKAADIVLNQDSLTTILNGVEAGRILFENLQLSIAYTLAHLWPEVLPILVNFTFGLPLGLDPMQILTIDLACELPPAIALAYERPECDIMKCPPRKKSERLVTLPLLIYSYVCVGSIISFGCMACYFTVYYYNDVELNQLVFNANDFWHGKAGNLTVNSSMGTKNYDSIDQMRIRGEAASGYQITLVISQVFHLFTCTTRRVSLFKHGIVSYPVFLAVCLEIVLLLIFIYVPSMQFLLGIQTPPNFVWLFGFGCGLIILIFTEMRKFLLRKSSKNKCISFLEW